MNNLIQTRILRKLFLPVCLFLFTITAALQVNAQEKPPKPIQVKVSTLRHLSFGTFIQSGTHGTVIVTHEGIRSKTGDIILPNMSSIVTAALFEVYSLPGTLVTILNGPVSELTGSNGGTLLLTIGTSSTGSPFITTGELTYVSIGGELEVGSLGEDPAGIYSGSFTVTFIQE